MRNLISFADLQHTGHPCNAFPLGIGQVASWAMKNIGDEIEVDVFRHPDDFAAYLGRNSPTIACFSNYEWNLNLNYQFARRIKKRCPDTVIVFGGPNYPLDAEEQAIFLQKYPDIDFNVFRDGERHFVELYHALARFDFRASKLKATKSQIPGCHYLSNGELVVGNQLPRVINLDEIPSPYLSGLFDKFFEDEGLMPLMLTARGCPFQCTFCQEGDEYFNRINRFSFDRVKEELHYIASRSKNPNLMFADSNFGMYKDDVEIAKEIVSIQEKYGCPEYFLGVQGKNNKARVLEVASIIQSGAFGEGSVLLSVAIQSTDEEVLKSVKRDNISKETYLYLAEEAKVRGANTFSELILGIPGDSKESHMGSVSELIDAGINVIRSHQFLMLQGSETSTRKSIEQYGMLTRFRVMVGTVNPYKLFGETFVVAEIDEVCVGNNTMSFDDYLECRVFDLTIEIFYNNGLFRELINYLGLHQISVSSFIVGIHQHIRDRSAPLSGLYEDFIRENLEIWEDREDLEKFLEEPGVLDRYMSGELGKNEQLVYRALAVFKHMSDLHNIAFRVAQEILVEKECYGDEVRNYLDELAEFSLHRKRDVLSMEKIEPKRFHYDFVSLEAGGFADDPQSFCTPEATTIEFFYRDSQKERISHYIDIHGCSNDGLGTILRMATLSFGSSIDIFYRSIRSLNPIGLS